MHRWPSAIVFSVRAFVFLFVALFAARPTRLPRISNHVEVQRIAKGLHFAEGPVWSYDGFLTVQRHRRRHACTSGNPGVGDTEVRPNAPAGPSATPIDTEGRLYTCEFRERRVTRTMKNGKVEVLAARFEGKRFNAPNDIVVRRDGHVYFTDPAFGAQQDSRELDFYGVFHITPKGELEAIGRNGRRAPTGSRFRPTAARCTFRIRTTAACALTTSTAKAPRQRNASWWTRSPACPTACAPTKKGIYTWPRTQFYVYARSRNGPAKLLGEVPLAETPSNLAFGDPDMETLYITARTSVYRVRLGVKGALPY